MEIYLKSYKNKLEIEIGDIIVIEGIPNRERYVVYDPGQEYPYGLLDLNSGYIEETGRSLEDFYSDKFDNIIEIIKSKNLLLTRKDAE